jgi:hypothetical protein
MKSLISVISMLLFSSCSMLNPELFKTIDDIATDEAVSINLYKEAFQKETESVNVVVSVKNKDK